MAADRTAARRQRDTLKARVDRELLAEVFDLGADLGFDGGVGVFAVAGKPSTTSVIQSAIWRNSASPKPRVVPAGVPRRDAEVMVGFSLSNGMPFLLQVMCARPSAFSVALPLRFGAQVDSIRCVSVSAGDDVEAALHQLVGQGLRIGDDPGAGR